MSSLFLEKLKNYFKTQFLYGRLLFSTEAEPIKNIYDVKLESILNSDTQKLEVDITALAYHKAIGLGVNAQNYNNIVTLINVIQIKEGNSPCFRNRRDCSEDKCCWMKFCFKES